MDWIAWYLSVLLLLDDLDAAQILTQGLGHGSFQEMATLTLFFQKVRNHVFQFLFLRKKDAEFLFTPCTFERPVFQA